MCNHTGEKVNFLDVANWPHLLWVNVIAPVRFCALGSRVEFCDYSSVRAQTNSLCNHTLHVINLNRLTVVVKWINTHTYIR